MEHLTCICSWLTILHALVMIIIIVVIISMIIADTIDCEVRGTTVSVYSISYNAQSWEVGIVMVTIVNKVGSSDVLPVTQLLNGRTRPKPTSVYKPTCLRGLRSSSNSQINECL